MNRNELLRQHKEREAALKEINRKYNLPASVKYDIISESGGVEGYAEYTAANDTLHLSCGYNISGSLLKSLRDVLNELLD